VTASPADPRPVGHALGRADQGPGHGRLVHRHKDAFLRGPWPVDGIGAHVFLQLRIDPVGGGAHGQFAQRGQVALGKEVLHRPRDLVLNIDLACAQPFDQLFGGQVDQLDFVGFLEDGVRHGFPHTDARDAGDTIVEGLQMLHVEGGQYVDTRSQHLVHVLPALFVPTALDIGMGQFIDQCDLRAALQQRVEVHLLQQTPAIVERELGQNLQIGQLRLGLSAAMGFDYGGDHVHAFGRASLRGLQHCVGLADARGGTEENLEPPAPFFFRLGQKGFRFRAALRVAHALTRLPCRPQGASAERPRQARGSGAAR